LDLLGALLGGRWFDRLSSQPRGPEDEGRAEGTLGALLSVGLLNSEEAELWRAELAKEAGRPPPADEAVREPADRMLEELLGSVDVERWRGDPAYERFEGALHALAELGAADPAAWDARWRERAGLPSYEEELEEDRRLNAGGTEQDLLAVITGPPEGVDGVQILYALRFADGVSLWLWQTTKDVVDETGKPHHWDEIELGDDLGTEYSPSGGGGGGRMYHLSFATPPPAEASWLEIIVAGEDRVRLAL
jgi:hypothetical protein